MVKPGYKQTEVGIIPEDWNVKRLGDFVSLQRGHDLTERERRPGNVPVMGSAGQNGVHATALMLGPGVIVGRSGASFGQVHYCEEDYWPHNTTLYVTDFQQNDPLFSFYFLKALNFDRYNTGGAQPSLNRNFIYPILIGVPGFEEQLVIAEVLGDVDGLLGVLEQLIAKKRDVKTATMQQLLTGKVRLEGFNGRWETMRLGEIAEITMGRTPSRRNLAYWGRGHTWLSIADMKSKWISSSSEEITELAASEMKAVPQGTLMMSFKLSIGRLAFAGCDLYTNEAICSFNRLNANAEFLYYILGRADFSLYGKQAVKGYTLNKDSLNAVEIPFPPQDEQAAIAAILSDMDAEIATLETRRAKIQAIKQGMMQELLTGRTRLL